MVRVQLRLAPGRFGGSWSWVESTLYLLVTLTILFESDFLETPVHLEGCHHGLELLLCVPRY